MPTHRRPCRSRNRLRMFRDGRQDWLGTGVKTPFTSRNSPRLEPISTPPAPSSYRARMLAVRSRSSAGSVVKVPSGRADHEAVAIETDEEAAGSHPGAAPGRRPLAGPDSCRTSWRSRRAAAPRRSRPSQPRVRLRDPRASRARRFDGNPVRCRQCLDPVALNPPDAIAVGAEPDAAVLVLQQHLDLGGRHPVRRVEAPDAVAGATNEHAGMTDPDRATAIHEERADRRGRGVRGLPCR